MKTDSVTAKDRHVINSSPLVDTKYENIWGVFGQWKEVQLLLYTISFCSSNFHYFKWYALKAYI